MDDSTNLSALDFTNNFVDPSTHHDSMDTGDNQIYDCMVIFYFIYNNMFKILM